MPICKVCGFQLGLNRAECPTCREADALRVNLINSLAAFIMHLMQLPPELEINPNLLVHQAHTAYVAMVAGKPDTKTFLAQIAQALPKEEMIAQALTQIRMTED